MVLFAKIRFPGAYEIKWILGHFGDEREMPRVIVSDLWRVYNFFEKFCENMVFFFTDVCFALLVILDFFVFLRGIRVVCDLVWITKCNQ